MKYTYTLDGVKKEIDLKPCPFCGGKKLVIVTKSLTPHVECISRVQYPGGSEPCGAHGPVADFNGWNKRQEGRQMKNQKSQHTPGPWTLSNGVMIAADSLPLGASSGRPEAETEANMRLIAAAPELLAAAKLVAARWPNCGDDEALRAINTAIASAEGRP